jgi:hypothetical protein
MVSINTVKPDDMDCIIAEVFSPEKQYQSIEEAAQSLTKVIYTYFQTDGESDFVLLRVFQSIEYPALPPDIQKYIIQMLGFTPSSTDRFLTLIGTYGNEKEWQQRAFSKGHQAIPLTIETLKTIPMVSRLFRQLGFNLYEKNEGNITIQTPNLSENDQMFYVNKSEESTALHITGVSGISGVFHVENAAGSPYIPAQDFVKRYGVQSVIGSGALLPQNEMAAFIGFSRKQLSPLQAAAFSPIISKFWHKAFPLLNYGIFS